MSKTAEKYAFCLNSIRNDVIKIQYRRSESLQIATYSALSYADDYAWVLQWLRSFLNAILCFQATKMLRNALNLYMYLAETRDQSRDLIHTHMIVG